MIKMEMRVGRVLAVGLFIAVMDILGMPATAQTDRTLKFIPEELDFGTIREDDGKVTRRVKAVNVSGETTFIISARTSCGCSAAEYPQQTLSPGDTTEISITYNPVNRPGKFLKTAKIYTGEERIGNSFKLKGMVIPSKKNLDNAYPVKSGQLRLSSPLVNAGEVSVREARPLFVGIYNDSDQPIMLSAASDSEPLEAAMPADSIEPFGISTLTLMLKGRKFSDRMSEFNLNAYIINAVTGDTLTRIPVNGIVKRDVNSK